MTDVEARARAARAAFTYTGPVMRKAQDLARDIAVSMQDQFKGRDLVLVGQTLVAAASTVEGISTPDDPGDLGAEVAGLVRLVATSALAMAGVTLADQHSPEGITALVAAGRYTWQTETDLQTEIADHLTKAGHQVHREVTLSGTDRVDLLVGRVGIEVKTKGSASAVTGQLLRYTHSPDLDALVLATTRPHLRAGLPTVLGGKPLLVALITGGAW